jgi:hypothetical protein
LERLVDELRLLPDLREVERLDERPPERLPDPRFFPPPSCLLTVAQARRSASSSATPLRS